MKINFKTIVKLIAIYFMIGLIVSIATILFYGNNPDKQSIKSKISSKGDLQGMAVLVIVWPFWVILLLSGGPK